jgi:hypothetical protein
VVGSAGAHALQHDPQVIEINWLQRDVIEPGVATEVPVISTAPPGQRDEDRGVPPRPPPYVTGDVEPGHSRHANIDERDVRSLRLDEFHSSTTTIRSGIA